jgi:hypothetical protein
MPWRLVQKAAAMMAINLELWILLATIAAAKIQGCSATAADLALNAVHVRALAAQNPLVLRGRGNLVVIGHSS